MELGVAANPGAPYMRRPNCSAGACKMIAVAPGGRKKMLIACGLLSGTVFLDLFLNLLARLECLRLIEILSLTGLGFMIQAAGLQVALQA